LQGELLLGKTANLWWLGARRNTIERWAMRSSKVKRSSKVNKDDLPSTRELATNKGSRFFFTGEPCKRGHLAPRYTSTGQCVDCQEYHSQKNAPPRRRTRTEDLPSVAEKIVSERGGRIISDSARSAKAKIIVECAAEHTFETNYDRLKQKKWCRICSAAESGRQQLGYTVEEMQRIAAERGGKFLSAEFSGVKQKHEFWCAKHGSFWVTPDNVIHTKRRRAVDYTSSTYFSFQINSRHAGLPASQ
jgi:hypothetical protein